MHKWTAEEISFLRENYVTMSTADLATHFGVTKDQVKSAAGNHGIKGKRRNFTEADLTYIREAYPDTSTEIVAKNLGRTVLAIYGIATKLGLHKSEEYQAEKRRMEAERLKTAGVAFRYPKGNVPANKGLRRPGWSVGRMKETQFKKGQPSGNWKPIGSERICSKDGYILIKVTEGQPLNYRHKHVVVWEEANGPVPKGHVVVFKDGDKLNCDLANLELITRAELMQRNTFHNFPEDVKAQIHVLAGFKRKLNSHAKKQDRRSQEPTV